MTTSKKHPFIDASSLPSDPETLRQMVLTLLLDVSDLSGQLEVLKRRLFGQRSEKIDPNQLALFEEIVKEARHRAEGDTEENIAAESDGTETISYTRKKGHGRKPLPEHLPRERIEYHPDKEELVCPGCGEDKCVMGEEVSEQLEYVPASMYVLQHVRYKYACKPCGQHVSIAPLPSRPIDRGLPGPGLLAHVAVSKYADHLPLHRMEGIFRRHRVDIARSTMCDWIGAVSDLLRPLVAEMKRQVLASKRIHTDDTPVPVQDRDRKVTRKGYLWVYIGDQGDVVYDYTPNRSRAGPMAFLGDYDRYVQADAYGGYDEYFRRSGATEVACWAHARRKFHDARFDDGRRCRRMLALIGKLYDVERTFKDCEPAVLRAHRQERSRAVLDEIHELLTSWSTVVLPRSPVGKAVQYAMNLWPALTRYLDDGDLAIDNNAAERALRSVVIGRKNWLFAGSDEGGRRGAVVYSLVQSCKEAEIDPYAYIRDVLTRVDTHPASEISTLIPRNWRPADSHSILSA
jgi:transposase